MGLEIQLIISVRYLIPSLGRSDFANFGCKHGVSRFEPNLPLLTIYPRLFWGPFSAPASSHFQADSRTSRSDRPDQLIFTDSPAEFSASMVRLASCQWKTSPRPKNKRATSSIQRILLNITNAMLTQAEMLHRRVSASCPWQSLLCKVASLAIQAVNLHQGFGITLPYLQPVVLLHVVLLAV